MDIIVSGQNESFNTSHEGRRYASFVNTESWQMAGETPLQKLPFSLSFHGYVPSFKLEYLEKPFKQNIKGGYPWAVLTDKKKQRFGKGNTLISLHMSIKV